MLDFTAIDFETANSYRGSPCSVGLVKVRNGVPVETEHWLIRPPADADWFDSRNVRLHGITPAMVEDAPRWKQVLPMITDFIGDDVVVAHNAAFDTGVIRYACAIDDIEWPDVRFLCTMVLARRILALPSYRLPYVVESLGSAITDHHDALSDASAVVNVVRGLADVQGAADLQSLAASTGVRVGQMTGGTYRGSIAPSTSSGTLTRADVDPAADPDGYLYGRVVVFTGKLTAMTRQVAWDECARVGALPEDNTTKRTQVLVVGDIDPTVLRPGSKLTGKARKAFDLQDKGQPIEVMTEDDFLRCLDGEPLAPVGDAILSGDEPPVPAIKTFPHTRALPLDQRLPVAPPKKEQVLKPPKPLRREPKPTDQICAVEGCTEFAAFRTRSRPTWCVEHIDVHYRVGGLRLLEAFSHPDDWLLTECASCAVQAHYRFVYVLDKNSWNEPVCRACYWRDWARQSRRYKDAVESPVALGDIEFLCNESGFDYLGPLTTPSLSDDPHLTRCRRCTKISADRASDIAFGCTCLRQVGSTRP